MSGLMKIAKQAANKVTYKVNELTYDPKAEADALQQKAAVPQSNATINDKNFNAFKGQWGTRATVSGMIDPKYFGTYQSILNIPAPAANANQETYDAAVNALAMAIKAWYVGAKYKGNLNELSFTIDSTKPKYTPPSSSSSSSGIKAAVIPVKPPTATDQFLKGFLGTLMTTLLALFAVFICLLSGSLAANDAIGRSPLMRFIVFIYSAIPFYTPFVLIYYVYRYFKGTYPMFYNFMPLTTSTSSNWILSTLLWPFYYIEDANSQFQKAEYDRIGSLFVWMHGPKTAERAAAAEAEAENLAAIKRATAGMPNGRMNNENNIIGPSANGRMNNENNIIKPSALGGALNMVANAINNSQAPPKLLVTPTQ
jgi:hypothetical protein